MASERELHWLTNKSLNTTADLFTGNTGVLHFLIRHSTNVPWSHPLWPAS
jgi:hypothetical protein